MRTFPPWIALLLAACGSDPPPSGSKPSPAVFEGTLSLDPLPADSWARLTQVLTVEATEAVRATLHLNDGADHQRTVQPPHEGTAFSTGIPGFHPGQSYTVTVQLHAVDDGALIVERDFAVEPMGLDGLVPELDLRVHQPDPTRGDTLFPVRSESGAGYLLMVDAGGELIWALDGGGTWWRTARLLEDGRLMLIADHEIVLTDWADATRVSFPPPAGTEGYHHEAIPRPGGGFFAFTSGALDVPNLPRSYASACDPGEPYTIYDSIVVEAEADGTLVQMWSLGERLDTHRLGWNGLDPTPIGPDWGHANGMTYVEEDDAFVISMRNQDLLLKLSRATGEVEWILSNPWGWAPEFEALRLQPEEPDFRWTFHQHAPEWSDGKLLVHDNGAETGMPCGPQDTQPRTTRVVEFAVDEENHTVRELWSWEGALFSPIMGDADRLTNGHVLVTYGQTDRDEAGVGHGSIGRGDLTGRLIEIDPQTGEVFWDLEVYEDDRGANPGGFKVPRSLRIHNWWAP